MGTDIHVRIETRHEGKWAVCRPSAIFSDGWGDRMASEPFGWRSYGMFGLFGKVSDYSNVPKIKQPTFSLPHDASRELEDIFYEGCWSWLTLRELTEFDYDQVFWNRRVTRATPVGFHGDCLAEEGEGEHMTVREFLGDRFFKNLEALGTLGAPDDVRIVFRFDN